jgi:CHAT domain-containing protein
LPAYLNNLGNGLRDRYARTGDLTDLQAGIENYQRAVQLTPAGSPDLPGYLNNLGTGLRDRYARTGDLTDLQAGIENYQRAVQLTPAGSPDLPRRLNNLGTGLRDRYARTGDLTDLQAGIENYQRAVQLTPAGSPDLPGYLNNLGNGFSNRYARTGDLTDLQAGIENFQQAAQRGLEVALEDGLTSARNWLRWAFGREAWEEVGTAYQFAYQASTRLFQTQLLRADQETWLKEFRGLAAHAAYAYAKQQRWEDAVVTLERGLAQLLSQALARDRANLEGLTQHGDTGKELYARYQQTTEALQLAQTKDNPSPDELRRGRAAVEQVIQEIQQVKGYETFLQAPTWTDIQAAATETRLVYIAVTKAGGIALIVGSQNITPSNLTTTITPVWLPDLTEEALQQQLWLDEVNRTADLQRGYLEAYFDSRQPKQDENEEENKAIEQRWHDSLEATTHWLWQTVIAPLIPHLPTDAKLTFLPMGRLAILPLHVAWTEDTTTPTGKRYALDNFQITYAPNARALTAARQVAQRLPQLDQLLAIEEPRPVRASPLPNAPFETATIQATFLHPTILKGEQATVAAVTAALPHCQVWHCSCHGFADTETPLNSSLVMANNEMLTLEKILQLRLPGLRLATLSACETGIPGQQLPEEIVNLPAGLLQAGAAGVLASLWSVQDLSTMMLMAYFYDQWRAKYPREPAEAFRRAQIWVRDTTNQEKGEYFQKELFATSTVKMAKPTAKQLAIAVVELQEKARSFAHPYYWGAFGWTGV